MRSLRRDLAVDDNHDAVGLHRSRQAVGDQHGRARLEEDVERRLYPGLRLKVEVRGRLVEHEDVRAGQERPGEGDQLSLARRQRLAPLLDDRVQALWQAVDQIDQPHGADGLVEIVVGCLRSGEGDVVTDGPREQEGLLRAPRRAGVEATPASPKPGRARR